MTDITEILKKILTSVYGRDMRQSIHDGIEVCKDTVDNGLEECRKKLDDVKKEHSDMREEYREAVKIAAEMETSEVDFEAENGTMWYMLVHSENGQTISTITKIEGDSDTSAYLQNVVLPVVPGEKYRVECARFMPGDSSTVLITYPIIAVEQVDGDRATGYCGSMRKPTSDNVYEYTVPKNGHYLLINHVQQPSSMNVNFRIERLCDTAKEYIQNIAVTPEECQKKLDDVKKEYDKRLDAGITECKDILDSVSENLKQSVEFQEERGSYWYVNSNRTVTKYGPDSAYLSYTSTVIPVTEGEAYEIHCARSGGSYSANASVIAVSNATNSEADGVIAIFENPTDGSNQYVLTVPTGAKFLLINHVVKSYSGIDMEIYKRNSLEDVAMGAIKDMFSATAAHNAIYRGKYLGDAVTAEQAATIADGSFEDLFIGDYWTMGGVNYRIADFDYWYRTGFPEASRVEKHHAVIVPDTTLATGQMNGSNTTSGGYRNSLMKSKMNDTISALPTEIRSRLLVHNAMLDGAWTEISVDPMNEIMVYGCYILADSNNKQTLENRQLSLFRMSPQARYAGGDYWLRNYANATDFTLVSYYGDASKDAATSTYGIRPVFAITGD